MTKWFTKTHQWFDDGTKEVGITPYAADQLGEISFVDAVRVQGLGLLAMFLRDKGAKREAQDRGDE